MKVNVLLFGLLQQRASQPNFTVETTSRTPQELYNELSDQGLIDYPFSQVLCAVAEEFAAPDTPLHPDAHVAFMPPMAGG
ncbi:MAG: MoaD/ThiS family protein [Opitutales bacterium]